MLGTRYARLVSLAFVAAVLAGCSSGGNPRDAARAGQHSTASGAETTVTSVALPTTASTASPAIGDPCLIGRWVDQVENFQLDVGGEKVPISGLAGVVVTFSNNGTEIYDWSASQPWLGQYRDQQVKVVTRGNATFNVRDTGGQLVETGPTQQVTTQFFLNGVPQQGDRLHLTGRIDIHLQSDHAHKSGSRTFRNELRNLLA